MKNLIIVINLLIVSSLSAVEFESSNLPIVILDTFTKEIPNEPKITSDMKIIWNEDGSRNYLQSTEYHYNGKIGIELRGSSSQYFFPKKQYAVETRDENGENLNVPLLGFPKENDWILHAPYSDKTLMRNVLTYSLSRKFGWYASRCKFCELVLNDQYMGIYILMEKIKQDKGRVNINKLKYEEISGDDLTGGYIIKIDKFSGENTEGWQSNYTSKPNNQRQIYYQYHDPKFSDFANEQTLYIKGKIDHFETLMSLENFAVNYDKIINTESFIDYFLINELTKNVDGYRLSTFLYKDKDSVDPLIYAGPIWDYNLAFSNANYYEGENVNDWMLDVYYYNNHFQGDGSHPPFWWRKLWNEENLRNQAVYRWNDLRKHTLSEESIFGMIDSITTLLNESKDRNYERWPDVLGQYIWPNPSGWQNRKTYMSEVNYMKSWIHARLDWIDENINLFNVSIENHINNASDYSLVRNYPNPFNPVTTIEFSLEKPSIVRIDIFNIKGELITTIVKNSQHSGIQNITFDASTLESGVYFYRVVFDDKILNGKCLLLK